MLPTHNRRPRRDEERCTSGWEKPWPFPGPAGLRESEELLVFDDWRYLGCVRSEAEIWSILDQGRPEFDRDTYRIVVRALAKIAPLRP